MGAVQALSCIPPSDRLTEGRPGACEGVRCPAASCVLWASRALPAPAATCQCHGVGTSCQQRILWRAVTHALHSSLAARPCRIGQGRRERRPHTIAHCPHCPVSQWSVDRRGRESLGSRYGAQRQSRLSFVRYELTPRVRYPHPD